MKKNEEELRAEFLEEAEALFDEMLKWDKETEKPDLTQIEDLILGLREQFGVGLAAKLLQRQEQRQPAEKVSCPSCGEQMQDKGQKGNRIESRIGRLEIERGHYYCPECRQGFFPPG